MIECDNPTGNEPQQTNKFNSCDNDHQDCNVQAIHPNIIPTTNTQDQLSNSYEYTTKNSLIDLERTSALNMDKLDDEKEHDTQCKSVVEVDGLVAQNPAKNRTKTLVARHVFPSENKNNYTRGCLFSPDGLCILTSNDDNTVRIFEPPQEKERPDNLTEKNLNIKELNAAVSVRNSGPIYDLNWYPLMNSSDPVTCCFAVTAQNQPVHLFDAYDGHLRATYRYSIIEI